MERARVEASIVGGGVEVEAEEEEEEEVEKALVSIVLGENDAMKPPSSPLARSSLGGGDPLARPVPEFESRRLRSLAAVDEDEKSRERPRAREDRRSAAIESCESRKRRATSKTFFDRRPPSRPSIKKRSDVPPALLVSTWL